MKQIGEAASEEAVFRVEGRFDQPAAIRLRQRVSAEETPRAILDFSHVESLDDAALPLLTVMLTLLPRKGRDVALIGLRGHQVRVLQHFGIEVAGGGAVRVLVWDEESLQD
jgi:anti-anti-sigma regulatory factor